MAAAAARPLVSVQTIESDMATDASPTVSLADVMKASIRPDIFTFVHDNISKKPSPALRCIQTRRHQTSAESWVQDVLSHVFLGFPEEVLTVPAKVLLETCVVEAACLLPPRFGAVGTGKSTLIRSTIAVASAIAASAVTSLVMARGHRIEAVPEMHLVISDAVESVEKTLSAIKVLKQVGAYPDVTEMRAKSSLRLSVTFLESRLPTWRGLIY
ncbi:Ribosomal protein L4/L1 family isoform 2 [Hibiscus syriacus]|uniref:Ribosomal protein L4/L1 family isoform 2 n=1 Tax=Hibiscus syriacus TaxID=106335 RepID=A0A6A3BEL8_HIBSY|nr:Ribosomal protein L4/L1 family isoform 2 [Hibiscus syriacus]